MMEYVLCNLCGADNAETLYEMPDVHFFPDERFTVVACRECGLGYLNPRPAVAEMDRYYPVAFYNYFDDSHKGRYEREAGYVLRHSDKASGTLLDVGCANGDFPRVMMSKGWQVEGLETASAASAIEDFKVHRVPLPELQVDGPTYDVVTAWAVMEHVHDPGAYFAKVAQILKPGGLFVFLVTNLDSLSSRALYREDVPRHTYFYNRRTVEAYLRQHGMTMVRARANRDIYEMKPVGWLVYKVARWRGLPSPSYETLSFGRAYWLRQNGLTPGWRSNLQFMMRYPLIVIDRLTAPLYARWQIMRGTYGIITFVARKDDGHG